MKIATAIIVLLAAAGVTCPKTEKNGISRLKTLREDQIDEVAKLNSEQEKSNTPLKKPVNPLTLTQEPNDDDPDNGPEKTRVFSSVIQIFLVLTGIYTCVFGFRVFRLLMIILGFYTSYYVILFALTEAGIFDNYNVGHQVGIFFGSIVLGFFISIICYMFEKLNFVIFGVSVGCVIGLFYAQFFVQFESVQDRMTLLAIVLGVASLVIIAAYFMLDTTIIFGSALIGSIITPINVGILLGDFVSFEERSRRSRVSLRDIYKYVLASGLMLITGICVQLYLRKRIIKKFQDENLNQIRGESFLN